VEGVLVTGEDTVHTVQLHRVVVVMIGMLSTTMGGLGHIALAHDVRSQPGMTRSYCQHLEHSQPG
jgi:hypothetical protein